MRERLIGGAGAVVYVIGMATGSPLSATAGALVTIAVLVSPLLQGSRLTLGAALVCTAAVLLPILWLWLPATESAWFAHPPRGEAMAPFVSARLVRLTWLAALILAAGLAFAAVSLRTPRTAGRPRTAATIASSVALVALAGEALLVVDAADFGAPAVVLAAAGVTAAGGLAVVNARRAPLAGAGVFGAYLLGRFGLDTLESAASLTTMTGRRPGDSAIAVFLHVTGAPAPDLDLRDAIVAACAMAGLALLVAAWPMPESAPQSTPGGAVP